ncbi:MAG: hypothetical protein EOP51_00220 [Sphingobacteriales bacterium]|nr:MAG: hypothetical protein EOP51_00220 [Sphingobacteriales bacterium]
MQPEQTPNDKTPMTTLSKLIDKAKEDGYTEDFKIESSSLLSANGDSYSAEQVTISNFYRFEGESDPDDEAILYLIETHNNLKGIIVSAYGPNAETQVHEFITQVNEIRKVIHDKKESE